MVNKFQQYIDFLTFFYLKVINTESPKTGFICVKVGQIFDVKRETKTAPYFMYTLVILVLRINMSSYLKMYE